MELDPHATADLTAFFTKRFPLPTDRASLAQAARVTYREPPSADPVAAWGGLLTRAKEQQALPRLATCAARRMPTDENLQGVSAVLNGRTWPPPATATTPPWLKQVGALTALLTIAGVAWAAQRPGPAPVEVHAEALSAAGAAETAAPPSVGDDAPERTAQAPAAPSSTEAASAAVAPTGSAVPPSVPSEVSADPRPEAAPPPPAEPAVGSAAPTDADSEAPTRTRSAPPESPPTASSTGRAAGGSCKGTPGSLVGYWYAGAVSPGAKGDRITVPRDLNVRADYPDRHNGYDRRTAIRCTLGVGQSLVLTGDPIAVPGGAYWVPLHAPGR